MMAKSEFIRQSLQARIAIDAKRPTMQQAAKALSKPRGGWIHSIRTALGMSTADLAARLGVAASTVNRLERSEVQGTANLESLSKVADALNCDLVYALVPRVDIEISVRKQALEVATRRLKTTQATMALEQQAVQLQVLNKLIEQKARELAESRALWKTGTRDVD